MQPKIIKTEAQHKAYLAEVERLASDDPAPGTEQGDRLELLAKLVEDYEKERYRFNRPDPISAIRFRMQEKGLRQKDIAPILGGKNRASEILSGKRPLTIPMIRALSSQLSLPADLLIGDARTPRIEDEDVAAEDIPLRYMVDSGWLPHDSSLQPAALVHRYLAPAYGPLYLRRTITYGTNHETNKTNLKLWVSRVRELSAQSRKDRGPWRPETFDEDFLQYVSRLSWATDGPRLAQRFLAEKGIALIVWPALPKTRLDGAAMRDPEGAPIIGMTLRFDRIDNFWFTLMHELVHAWKHLPEWDIAITDEGLDRDRDDDDMKEAEANRLARDIFIPRSLWKRSEAYLYPSEATIQAFADRLHINPAIIAGRLRREKTGFRALGRLVGNEQVRKLFTGVDWEAVR